MCIVSDVYTQLLIPEVSSFTLSLFSFLLSLHYSLNLLPASQKVEKIRSMF